MMSLEDDKERIKFEHKLALRRLIFEKILFASIAVIVGLMANILIEKYKGVEEDRRFLLQKRYEAISDNRAIFSLVTSEFFKMTEAVCTNKKIKKEQYGNLKKQLYKLISSLNSSLVVLNKDYEHNIGRVVNIFFGFSSSDYPMTCAHRSFGSDLADFFTNSSKAALTVQATSANTLFSPLLMSKDEMDKIGTNKYTELNFRNWRKYHLKAQ